MKRNGDRPGPRSLLVIPIMLVALFLRIRDLGALGLWIDEPLTWMAVQGILSDGVPRFPSGMIYTRAPVYSYITSLFAWIGGDGEFALRLPSVIASVALIPLVYRFGRDLAGEAVGLVSAVILAVSPWDVHYARMARMYSVFLFFFVLALYLIYRGFVLGKPTSRKWAIGVSVIAALAHEQGAALVVVLLVPLLFPRRSGAPLAGMLGGAAAVAIAAGARLVFESYGLGQGPQPIEAGERSGAVPVPILGALDLNFARIILLDVARANVAVGLAAAALIAAMGAWAIARAAVGPRRVGTTLAAIAFALALLTNQLALVALAIALVLKLGERDATAALRRTAVLGLMTIASVAITVGAAAIATGPSGVADRSFVRLFFAFPVPWYRLLIDQFPFMSIVAFATVAVFLFRSLPEHAHQGGFFVAGSFIAPLLLMGIMPAPYFLHRYNFYLNPVFTMLFAVGLVGAAFGVARMVTRRSSSASDGRRAWPAFAAAAALIAAGLVASGQADPAQAWAVSHRHYGDNRDLIRDPDVVGHFYYDTKTTAAYVRSRREADDIVIARDPVGLYPYLGRSTHVLRGPYYGQGRTHDGRAVDVYLGMPHLRDAAELEQVLANGAGRRVWFIMSVSRPDGPDVNTPADILGVLDHLRSKRVYTGGDSLTYVLRIDPEVPRGTVKNDDARITGTRAGPHEVKG